EHADHVRQVLLPRQVDGAGGEVVRAGQVEERRQQVLLADLPGGYDLRHVEGVQPRTAARRLLGRIDVGQGRVRGAEVDSDEVAGHRPIPYSAGYYDTRCSRTRHRRGEPQGRDGR